jgi:hypothetical protein
LLFLFLFSFWSALVHARTTTRGRKKVIRSHPRGGKNAAATKDDEEHNNEKKTNIIIIIIIIIIIRVVGIVQQADKNSRSSFPFRARVSLVVIVVVIINTIIIIYDGRGEKVD